MTPVSLSILPPDLRGYIAHLEAEGQRFNVLWSKKGSFRGGDLHPNTQFNYVLKGSVRIVTTEAACTVRAGECSTIPAQIPHYFRFLAPTLMIEWWSGPFQATYYPPFRKFVEASL